MNLQTLKLSFPHWTNEEIVLEMKELRLFIIDEMNSNKQPEEYKEFQDKLNLLEIEYQSRRRLQEI